MTGANMRHSPRHAAASATATRNTPGGVIVGRKYPVGYSHNERQQGGTLLGETAGDVAQAQRELVRIGIDRPAA